MTVVEGDIHRTVALRAAHEALMTGRGVIVSGERGSGRSTFVRSVVAGVDEPLRRRLWVHDDDSPLDGQSGKRLAEAVVRGDVVPVLVTAVRSSAEPWLDRLTDEFEPLRLRLDPFDRAAVLRIARRLLGGPLAAEAVPILLPRRDGGDLVVLREALRELQATGALAESDGTWSLSGPSPRLEGLRRLLFARLDLPSASVEAETALDLVALAPELGLARTHGVLSEMTGAVAGADSEGALEMLESSGAIDVLGLDGSVRCRVHDPVAEQLLPLTMGRLRRRRLSNAVVEALSDRPAGEAGDRELLALARLALPLGWAVDGEALTRAAETALRASRVDLASRLAAAALVNGAPVEASFVLAAADSQLGHPGDALLRLQRIEIDEDLDPDRARIHAQLTHLVRARIADPNSSWSLPTGASGSRVDPESEFASLSIEHGAGGEGVNSIVPIDHSIVLEGERIAFEASVLVMRGHSDDAVRELRDAEVVLRTAGADTFRVRWGQIYSLLWDQSFDATLEQLSLLGDEAASLGRAEQESLCRWSAALTLGHAGRAAEAVPELRTALVNLERHDLAEAALLARIALAKALAKTGSRSEALTMLAPVLAASEGRPLLEGWARDAHGWVLHGLGEDGEAVDEFLAAASIHSALGFSLSEMIALSGAARSGAAAMVVDRMEELSESVDGCSVALLVRQARALARRELDDDDGPDLAAEFDGIGEAAASLGMHAHAHEAFTAAADLHGAAGDARPAAASARRAAEQSAVCSATSGAVGPIGSELSEREREIVDLVLESRSNREIAETLVLSVRTVETHLLRVYRKLGVRGRNELAGALSGFGVGIPGASKALQDSELNS